MGLTMLGSTTPFYTALAQKESGSLSVSRETERAMGIEPTWILLGKQVPGL